VAFRKEDYIAVFDSGLGGISVLQHLRRIMPTERYLYFGDCANAPYGTRSTAQVRELTMAAVDHILGNYPVKALVVACNTATAAAISHLRALYPDLIVIGIEPALKLAADRFPGGNLGVMATDVTLREEKFQKLWTTYAGGCQVYPISVPGLVELVEQGREEGKEAETLLTPILAPYVGKLDALVLGCTHYPFASKAISGILGDHTVLLDGGDGTARETRRRLALADLLAEPEQQGNILLRSSGDDTQFQILARRLLGE
jgi:glutamate racemase